MIDMEYIRKLKKDGNVPILEELQKKLQDKVDQARISRSKDTNWEHIQMCRELIRCIKELEPFQEKHLCTPFGKIMICIDGQQVPCSIWRRSLVEYGCETLQGRYLIFVEYVPDGKIHTISCRMKDYKGSSEDYIETGERLELKSFCRNGRKISLGMEGDFWYLETASGEQRRESIYGYDYDCGYLDDGVQYEILPFTKTRLYIFGVAWGDDKGVATWIGADPVCWGI